MMRTAPDVLIVGAGPTGLMLAAELAMHEVSVRLVDKSPQASTTSKALGVQARTLEILERHGLAEKAVAQGHPVRGVRIHDHGKELAHISLDKIRSRYPYVLILPQSGTEGLLAQRVSALGVAIERGTEVVAISPEADGLTVTMRHPDSVPETLRAAYVVGCDGAHSFVRHAFDIPFEGYAIDEFFSLADLHLDWNGPADELSVYMRGGEVVAVFPMGQGRTRLIIAHAQPLSGDPMLPEFVDAVEACGPRGAKLSDATWMTRFKISQRQVKKYRVGRAFLAGDAAHIHSPLGGQGMNTGIQDACNLAWKLALVIKGQSRDPEALLDSYERERRPLGALLLKATGFLSHALLWKNPIADAVRDQVLSLLTSFDFVQSKILDSISEIGIEYHGSPIVLEKHGGHRPHAGDRAPDIDGVEKPGGATISLFEALRTPRHALLLFFSGTGGFNFPIQYSEVMHIYTVSSPAARHAFGADQDAICLIRPDGYIAFRGSMSRPEELTSYIESMFRGSDAFEKSFAKKASGEAQANV